MPHQTNQGMTVGQMNVRAGEHNRITASEAEIAANLQQSPPTLAVCVAEADREAYSAELLAARLDADVERLSFLVARLRQNPVGGTGQNAAENKDQSAPPVCLPELQRQIQRGQEALHHCENRLSSLEEVMSQLEELLGG